MNALHFRLPEATPLLNRMLGFHYRTLKKRRLAMAWAVNLATAGRRPDSPIPRVIVRVVRRTTGPLPDHDNAMGGLKWLLDVMQPCTPKRLYGLGIIASDAPGALQVDLKCELSTRRATGTEVWVEPVE